MLKSRTQKPIPERLSHHTTLEAVKSILSDTDGKGICFRVVSNKFKNDSQEIKMGEYMLERIRKAIPEPSMLHDFGGYNESASLSFMEGETTIGMLEKYGYYRLEFDLRPYVNVGALNGFIDCEYVPQEELIEYADDYCSLMRQTLDAIPRLQEREGIAGVHPVNVMISFIMMENDIMAKVFGMKEYKWHEEKEWRVIKSLRNEDKDIHYTTDDKPYLNQFFPKEALTGITIFYSDGSYGKATKEKAFLEGYLRGRGYIANVNLVKKQ